MLTTHLPIHLGHKASVSKTVSFVSTNDDHELNRGEGDEGEGGGGRRLATTDGTASLMVDGGLPLAEEKRGKGAGTASLNDSSPPLLFSPSCKS